MGVVTFVDPSDDALLHIYRNLRPADRRELDLTGITEDNFLASTRGLTLTVGCLDDEPVAFFGHYIGQHTIWFIFAATPTMSKFWKSGTQWANAYIGNRCAEHPHLMPLVGMDPDNRQARRWLTRLGFSDTGEYLKTPKGKLVLLERR